MRFLSLATALLSTVIATGLLAAEPVRNVPRLVSEETHRTYLAAIPDSVDGALQKLKSDPGLILYDNASLPPAYQFWGFGGTTGVHSPNFNISIGRFDGSERFGNANIEFPWGGPAGTSPGVDGSQSFKGVRFPADGKVRVWRQHAEPDNDAAYHWKFPVGTTFVEVIQVTNPRTRTAHTCQVRTRTRQENGWTVNEYRPFTTPKELEARIESSKIDTVDRDKLLGHLKSERNIPAYRIRSPQAVVTVDRTGLADSLPAVSEATVLALLQGPFVSALNKEWVTTDQHVGYAPTTNADFHVVPKGYQGYAHEVSSKACMVCHETTFKHTNHLDRINRDWYGRVRGHDNIFSWHPFHPGSISDNGYSRQTVLDPRWTPFIEVVAGR